jgi:ABC-type phosphate/phosphonate transport system substrate-binding protein
MDCSERTVEGEWYKYRQRLRSYRNGGCCEDIAFNVYLKVVDAGVICDHFLEQHPDRQNELGIDVKQMIVIGKTKPVPTRVFAASNQVDKRMCTKITRRCLALTRKTLSTRRYCPMLNSAVFARPRIATMRV